LPKAQSTRRFSISIVRWANWRLWLHARAFSRPMAEEVLKGTDSLDQALKRACQRKGRCSVGKELHAGAQRHDLLAVPDSAQIGFPIAQQRHRSGGTPAGHSPEPAERPAFRGATFIVNSPDWVWAKPSRSAMLTPGRRRLWH
jgi:hypothetical protein